MPDAPSRNFSSNDLKDRYIVAINVKNDVYERERERESLAYLYRDKYWLKEFRFRVFIVSIYDPILISFSLFTLRIKELLTSKLFFIVT